MFNSSRDSTEHSQRDIEEAVKHPIILEDQQEDGGGGADEGVVKHSPDWEQREKQRRQQDCREMLKQEARTGQRGHMRYLYLDTLSTFLTHAHELGQPEVFYQTWRVPTNYLINSCLVQILSILTSSLASLSSSDSELKFSIFQSDSHSEPDSDFTFMLHSRVERNMLRTDSSNSKLKHSRYVVCVRDLRQWKETTDPHNCTVRYDNYWPNEQQFLPLSSWKQSEERSLLLSAAAKKRDTFYPRQRMVFAYIADGTFHLWMYNVIDDRVREIKTRITNLVNWQLKRSGLLYDLLSQKMGLFHHTGAKDVAPLAQKAIKHCNTLQGTLALVNNVGPVASVKPTRHGTTTVDIDHFYHDLEPSAISSSPDPVERHGLQFKDTFLHHRESMNQSDLLLKVFNTWDSRDGRRNKATDQTTSVSSDVITKLKLTSRLLHYCSSTIWLLCKSYVSNLPETNNEQTILEDASSWFNCIREIFIKEYISYLETLHFQPINERAPSKPPRGHHPHHQHTATTKFYKCLQRSWPGGIILIELSFQTQLFLVKLYSLELSRSSSVPLPNQDVFSQECSRIKDFIHTHSYNYDFHVRNIHSVVLGRLKVEGELDLRNLLNEFCSNYVTTPYYIRNRIATDRLSVKVSVPSKSLYTYIIGHCGEYNLQRIDIIQASGEGCGSSIAWDNCLMIDLRSSIHGKTTTMELSNILKETRDMYHVMVLALPDVNVGEEPVATEIPLVIYMLLVNKIEMYPRLTVDSPLVSTYRRIVTAVDNDSISTTTTTTTSTTTSSVSDIVEKQSQFHDSVKLHRRKLGYGSLGSPSSLSEMVFNPHILKELMDGLKVHFENVIKTAQSHVRRNDLWKRLLYGGISPEISRLSCGEFQELLFLVDETLLEQIDPILDTLTRQTIRWYHSLIEFLQCRYGDSFRVFTSTTAGSKYAVLINQGWYDMFILIKCENQQQGFYTVYRKQHERRTSGGKQEERHLTADKEAEEIHINEFVNCVCSFLWADIVSTTPSLSPKLRHSREK